MLYYDFEEQRINAFIITDKHKIYEGFLHTDCLLKAIEEAVGSKEFNKNNMAYYNMTDKELKNLIGEVVVGEIATIENKKSLIYYDKDNFETIKNSYDLSNYRLYYSEELDFAV